MASQKPNLLKQVHTNNLTMVHNLEDALWWQHAGMCQVDEGFTRRVPDDNLPVTFRSFSCGNVITHLVRGKEAEFPGTYYTAISSGP